MPETDVASAQLAATPDLQTPSSAQVSTPCRTPASGTDSRSSPFAPDEPPDVGSCHLDGDIHSHVFVTVDRAVELIGGFLQGNREVAGASGCEGGGGLVLYARAVDGEVVGEFPLLVTLKVYVPAGRVLDGRVIVNSDSVTVIAVSGAAAVVPAGVDGTVVVAGLLLPLLQPARVTAAAMKISPRRGFIVVPFETSSYALTNVSAGQTVHRSPPLKRRLVTTKQRKPGVLRVRAGLNIMSAAYTGEGKTGEGCLRDRRNRPSAPRPADGRYGDRCDP